MRRQRAGIGQRWRKGCRSYGRRFVTTSASPPIPFRLFAARAIRPASRSVVVLHFVRRRFFADAEQEISDLFWPDFSMPSESFPRKLFFSAEFSPTPNKKFQICFGPISQCLRRVFPESSFSLPNFRRRRTRNFRFVLARFLNAFGEFSPKALFLCRIFADAEQEISDLFWPDFSMPSE